MLKYGDWDLPGIDYFQFKNSFKGSRGRFRFSATGKDDCIKVLYWAEDVCLEEAKNIVEKEFELCEQSLFDINRYLTEKYNDAVKSVQ